jgi:hypothetical protein
MGDPVNTRDPSGAGFGCFLSNNWASLLGIALGAAALIVSGGTASIILAGLGAALSTYGTQQAAKNGDEMGMALGMVGTLMSTNGLGIEVGKVAAGSAVAASSMSREALELQKIADGVGKALGAIGLLADGTSIVVTQTVTKPVC